MKTNWVDRFVDYFDPVAGANRRKHRFASERMETVQRKYDAAAKGVRMDGWQIASSTVGSSANAQIGPAIHLVRERARDLIRNNGYAAGGTSGIVSSVIGTGIIGQPFSPEEGAAAQMLTIWRQWSESTDCDADGLHDLNGLQNLAFRCMVEGGEAIIRRKWVKNSGNLRIPVPLQVQVLEGDYIDTTKNQPTDSGGYILQGVEFDKSGRRIAYWLWNQHPGEVVLAKGGQSLVSQRVDAKDIAHLFRVDRAGQVRGISWFAPCILRMKDFDLFEDAVNMRMQIAACFSAFVRDIEAPQDITKQSVALSDKLSPGAIEILPNGKTIEFPNMPAAQDDGHSIRMLRGIAKGLGVTYETFTGDYSQVNYSSGRMGWIAEQRNIEQWRWLTFIPRMCSPIYGWFTEAAMLSGYKAKAMPIIWTPPKREMIDPTKEIPAERDAVRSGFKSLSEAIREQGRIPDEVFKEIKKDADTVKALGLVLDTDPSQIARGGNAQPTTPDAANTGAQ